MDNISISSFKGAYDVYFRKNIFEIISEYEEKVQFIIDSNVYELYEERLKGALKNNPFILIEANESNKDLVKIPNYISQLVENQVKRDHTLVAIGGGITQDVTCYIALTLFRGMDWHFFPTTLLAQSDSCIGSKSSINVNGIKNLVGTFLPPRKIFVSTNILKSLKDEDIRSGVGEMLKVHMVDGHETFKEIANVYEKLFTFEEILVEKIYKSLLLKKKLIEIDEFDQKERNVMNYGHGFGHAIESATKFAIPHGIAVTIGMDMANYYSFRKGELSKDFFELAHRIFKINYKGFANVEIPFDEFIHAFSKDKKNIGKKLALILAKDNKPMDKYFSEADNDFKEICQTYFKEILS